MSEIVEIEFISNDYKTIQSALTEIMQKENIMTAKFTYENNLCEVQNIFDCNYWNQNNFNAFINLKKIENNFFLAKFPSINILKRGREIILTLIIETKYFHSKKSNLFKSIYNFSQNLAKLYEFSDYYAGLEPAGELETRMFTKNEPGPIAFTE